MKRFAALLVLLALASSARASGVGLRWGSCEGTANRSFACDKSTGSELLVGSFSPPGGVNQLTGIEVVLSIAAADGSVPSWWQMYQPGSCRRSSIAASFDVTDQAECDDPWNGQATGGIGRYQFGGATGVDMWLVAAVAESQVQGVSSGRTYAAFKLLINHQKSNGAAACGGCDTPVCITLSAIRLAQGTRDSSPASHGDNATTAIYSVLTDGINGMGGQSQIATWQGGTPNCGAGASKPSTWSELKSRFKSK